MVKLPNTANVEVYTVKVLVKLLNVTKDEGRDESSISLAVY